MVVLYHFLLSSNGTPYTLLLKSNHHPVLNIRISIKLSLSHCSPTSTLLLFLLLNLAQRLQPTHTATQAIFNLTTTHGVLLAIQPPDRMLHMIRPPNLSQHRAQLQIHSKEMLHITAQIWKPTKMICPL